ncbi:hypothetical protein [Streptomyces sp. RTGN2]|uniref:hypothetical protein n=1 Tax=unclassified Streptomyces TaxID=2593676 RepID=UPI002552C206|nr:hypothetical protein [Streptomyces sp. RTGN2]
MNRPKHMDAEDEFEPISLTIDDLMSKLRKIRAAHGNVEAFALGLDGQYITFDGILVDRRTYPNIAVINRKESK